MNVNKIKSNKNKVHKKLCTKNSKQSVAKKKTKISNEGEE